MEIQIQRRTIAVKDALEGLEKIFSDLQDPVTGFHDKWDWMKAEFYLDVLRCVLENHGESV